jgi:predicted small metal-binding protein
MRVIECDECGETLSAANDEELGRALAAHLRNEHHIDRDEDDIAELLAGDAYDAMDS